jgi:hypothetical protein
MMAMVAIELLMMLGMVMTVMVIPIADMTVATMEAVILQSMTSTRNHSEKPCTHFWNYYHRNSYAWPILYSP